LFLLFSPKNGSTWSKRRECKNLSEKVAPGGFPLPGKENLVTQKGAQREKGKKGERP